ncbi:hypothetical protein Tco_0595007 [Tanacetum coccineum]
MAGLWFRMFRGDRTVFKETMLGVLLLQAMGELRIELEKMLLMQAQENGVDLDEEQLLFLAGGQTNTFDDDADQCDAFDSDVDEAPTTQTMFMANLSLADPDYEEAGPSYDSDALSEKENKLLEEFLDMKHLKEKVKDKLYKQDQSLQTVHMLCKPKSFYDEVNRVAIGYKNPFYLSKAKQVQPALYNGYEIFKPNHDRALVHDSDDTLEIADTTRKQMIEK